MTSCTPWAWRGWHHVQDGLSTRERRDEDGHAASPPAALLINDVRSEPRRAAGLHAGVHAARPPRLVASSPAETLSAARVRPSRPGAARAACWGLRSDPQPAVRGGLRSRDGARRGFGFWRSARRFVATRL